MYWKNLEPRLLCQDLKYYDNKIHSDIEDKAMEISKMLSALMNSIKNKIK